MVPMASPKAPVGWLTLNALAWIFTNFLGAIAFLFFASQTWIEPELRGEDVGREGDAVVWFGTALPVAFACLLLDVVMVVLAVRVGIARKQWSPFLVAGGIGIGWAVTIRIDVAPRF